jgi:alkanesulfonate monooxygenase SsuD/methylene tetrahydromethanopterin reductase-like flavin-dependent oxidoreductase (luciferase family)
MDRIAIALATFSGLSIPELQELAREAEAAGFEAVFSPEFMNDALADCQVMAHATSRIKVGTCIANIYLRHPALCAQAVVTIDAVSQGRFILGLGVSHRPIVEGMYHGKMEQPHVFLREYINTVRNILTGKGYPGAPTPLRAATYGVRLYLAAVALRTAELAGEVSDGVMLALCPKNRLLKVQTAIEKGAAKARRPFSAIEITTVLHACISEDLSAARAAAKQNLALYGSLPFYNKLFHDSGFVQEAAALARGDASGATNALTDEVSLVGSPARCREQLAAFRATGVQLPIVMPVPVAGQSYAQAVRTAIETFA